jgi:hypothetical protein
VFTSKANWDLWDPISNRKVNYIVIHGLHGNKIKDQIAPIDHVVMQVKEVFLPNTTMLHNELVEVTKLKELKRCTRIWLAKFFKLACPHEVTNALKLGAHKCPNYFGIVHEFVYEASKMCRIGSCTNIVFFLKLC